MEKLRIGINGFGRIGRMVLRNALERDDIEVVAINDILDIDYIAYLFKFDSAHRTFKGEITIKDNFLVINGSKIRITSYESPKDINWADVNAQYIAECTGRFLTKELASQHISAGAKKVVMSAPSKDDTPMFVCGVNLDEYNGDDIVSNASCTTNCLAPIVKVIHDNIGIESGLMTTVHPITASQSNIDIYSKRDYRAGRAGLNNIIPYTTGAAKSIGRVIPQLNNKLTGICFRIPTIDVSVIDLTINIKKECSYNDICNLIKQASCNEMLNIIKYVDEQVISQDFLNDKTPSIFDSKAGLSISNKLIKLIAWYDNEIGYSNKLLDLIVFINKWRNN